MAYNGILLFQFVMVFLSLMLIVLVGREKPSREQKYLYTMSIGLFLNSTGYVMVLMSSGKAAAEYGTIVQCMGSCIIMPFFLMFILSYCRIRMKKWIPRLICFISILVFFFILTNQYHHLYFREYTYIASGQYPRVLVNRGPLYFFYLIPLAVYDVFINAVCIYKAVHEKDSEEKKRLWLFCITSMVSIVTYVLYVLNLTGGYNPLTLSYFLICLCVLIVIVRFHLFDTLQVAQEDILETMEEGFLVFQTDETVLYYNAAAKRFFPELEEGHCLEILGRIAELEEPENIMITRKNSVLRLSIYPVYVRNIFQGYKGWIFDCTQAELQKKRFIDLKEQAEQANLAKSRFLAGMSHELRTPMNAILGMAQLLQQAPELPDSVKEYVFSIHHAGTSMLSTINDVLDFAQIDSGRLEIITENYRIDSLLRELDAQTMIKLGEKEIGFEMEVEPELPVGLIGDGMRLRQMISILLNNAVKYTDFGKIVLRAGIADLEKEGRGKPEEGKTMILSIEIADTGIGIREESLQNIFQPFQQAAENEKHFQEGKGLGLSIVKRLLDLMGGEILVKSVYGCGSTFQMMLPQEVGDSTPIGNFVRGNDRMEQTGEPFLPVLQAPAAKVLAVDDNAVNLKVLKGLLSAYGIQADTALSGLECLEILKEEDYDMVFLDYMMPEMDGIETLHLMRNLERDCAKTVPVIAVTANAVRGAREMFLEKGFQGYLSKPVDRKHMEDILLKNLPPGLVQKEEEQKKSAFQIQIEGIDYERGLAMFAGDREQYLMIMESVAEEGRNLCIQMSEELALGDIKNYTIHAHALKGITANLGADHFSEMAKTLEFAGKEGREDDIYQNHEAVMDAFETLAGGMDRLLRAEKGQKTGAVDEKEISMPAFLEKLSYIKESLEEYDQTQALELVEECLTYRLGEDVRQGLEDIREQIRSFRYEEPKERTEALMAEIQKQG